MRLKLRRKFTFYQDLEYGGLVIWARKREYKVKLSEAERQTFIHTLEQLSAPNGLSIDSLSDISASEQRVFKQLLDWQLLYATRYEKEPDSDLYRHLEGYSDDHENVYERLQKSKIELFVNSNPETSKVIDQVIRAFNQMDMDVVLLDNLNASEADLPTVQYGVFESVDMLIEYATRCMGAPNTLCGVVAGDFFIANSIGHHVLTNGSCYFGTDSYYEGESDAERPFRINLFATLMPYMYLQWFDSEADNLVIVPKSGVPNRYKVFNESFHQYMEVSGKVDNNGRLTGERFVVTSDTIIATSQTPLLWIKPDLDKHQIGLFSMQACFVIPGSQSYFMHTGIGATYELAYRNALFEGLGRYLEETSQGSTPQGELQICIVNDSREELLIKLYENLISELFLDGWGGDDWSLITWSMLAQDQELKELVGLNQMNNIFVRKHASGLLYQLQVSNSSNNILSTVVGYCPSRAIELALYLSAFADTTIGRCQVEPESIDIAPADEYLPRKNPKDFLYEASKYFQDIGLEFHEEKWGLEDEFRQINLFVRRFTINRI